MAVTVARVGARSLGMIYTALAATCWSLAGILQRQLRMSLASQLAGRAVFAFLAVLAFVAIAERGQILRAFRAIGRPGLAIAGLIGIASVSFITALNDAPVADVVVVQALCPLAAALLGILSGELVRPRTWAAMAIAVVGFAVMAGAPGRPGLAGMSFSLIAMLAFAAAIVVARHNAHVSMAPATCLSQVLVFAVFAPFARLGEMHGASLGYLVLLGAVQMGLGLFFFSLGARLISAAEVAIIAQLENVLGPLWVWLAGIEHPSAATIVGGVVVIAAVAYQVTGSTGQADSGLRLTLFPSRPGPEADRLRWLMRRTRRSACRPRLARCPCPRSVSSLVQEMRTVQAWTCQRSRERSYRRDRVVGGRGAVPH